MKHRFIFVLVLSLVLILTACTGSAVDNSTVDDKVNDVVEADKTKDETEEDAKETKGPETINIEKFGDKETTHSRKVEQMENSYDENVREIWLAGGCFWGVEAYMAKIPGIIDVTSGYANGETKEPKYYEVVTGNTGYAEAVHVKYDPNVITLKGILHYYFRVIEPTVLDRQGNDVGNQYRTGIYYNNTIERSVIENYIREEQKDYDEPIVVEVEPFKNYYLAEENHQDYLVKNPNGYCHIDFAKLNEALPEEYSPEYVDKEAYEKPDEDAIKDLLSEDQFRVTQNNETEIPVMNEFYNDHAPGIYVDIVTGEPLFVSTTKFDSGCGWPSFTKPISEDTIVYIEDNSLGMTRIEVRSRVGDSHLGHVFEDGPRKDGGLRYCINKASLKFIPVEEMEEKGYGQYIELVDMDEE